MDDSKPTARHGRRGPAPSRSKSEVGRAAVQLADRSGLAAVSIRSVAERLGLTPTALYRYVDCKDDLVEAMADLALDDLSIPAPTGDVTVDLTALVRAQSDVMRAHPWLIETLPTVRPGPAAVAVLEAGLRVLADEPATSAAKLELLGMLTGVATLFARADTTPPAGTVQSLTDAARTHPYLAAAFADPRPPDAERDLLSRTVDALVQGLLL